MLLKYNLVFNSYSSKGYFTINIKYNMYYVYRSAVYVVNLLL